MRLEMANHCSTSNQGCLKSPVTFGVIGPGYTWAMGMGNFSLLLNKNVPKMHLQS